MAEASTSTDQATPGPQQRRSDPLPGSYTVVWSTRNNRDEPNFVKINPTFGDGDTSRWPESGPDMTLLGNDHDKQRQWRKTAGELLAKDLGHYSNENAAHWMLADLPKGYALFQQVTHPKGEQTQREGGKRLRLDRFIFGHDGRKIRSALSLGKHISWQLFDKPGQCPCDGCKVIGKAVDGGSPAAGTRGIPRKRKTTGDGQDEAEDSGEVSSGRGRGRARLARTAASRAAGAKGKGKRKSKGKEWEDDEDDEDEIMYDEEDEEEAAYSSDYAGGGGGSVSRTTSSGRQSRPTSKFGGDPLEVPNDEISQFMTPAPNEVALASSTISIETTQQDLRMPTLPRAGELVWCRVPLARPPGNQRKYIGDADFSRWPGIVRARKIKGQGEDTDIRFKVELLAQNAKDSLESVKTENLMPWLQFIPANTAHMDKCQWTWEQFNKKGEKKGWGDIQTEGWPSVVGAYWRGHRIAKCFAAIQIRSLPTVAVGAHLAAKPDVPATSRSALQEMPPRSRYLTYSHILYGPELIHVGDFVRLVPGTDLGPTIDRSGFDPDRKLLSTSLILQIEVIYRGGAGSPLMARGPIYEMVELPDPRDPSTTAPVASSGGLPPPGEISSSVLKTMPRPFPHHKWRCISTRGGEVDVLFQDIAGRYYALNRKVCENPEVLDTVLKKADQQVEKKTDLSEWAIGKGGVGLNGYDALRLTLAGLCGESRTTRILAFNGAEGNRDDQLRLAEMQARAPPSHLRFVGKPKPAVPVDAKAAEDKAKAKAKAAASANATPEKDKEKVKESGEGGEEKGK